MSRFAISADDVRDAARQIKGVAVLTPLLEFAPLNARAGHRVLIKFEGLQHTGSFKFRGAYNRLSRLSDAEKKTGVVAWSSGNHAQGVAAAAKMLGMPAVIVMPKDAPKIKLENTKALGAEVVLYDRYTQSREDIGAALAKERGAVLVPSFDDPLVMAGQGTIGLEIMAQAAEAGVKVARVLCPCSGGGLLAGISTAVKDAAPETEIYSVEPEDFSDTARSLKSGVRESNPHGKRSICDALLAPQPGELTFPILLASLTGGLSVNDGEVAEAMRFALREMKLVSEAGGAVALAALLAGKLPVPEAGASVVVISGANVDPEKLRLLMQ